MNTRRGGFSAALMECWDVLSDVDRWSSLAGSDIRLRYRRTVVGPWSTTLSTTVMVASIGVMYAAILGQPLSSFIPYFAAGMVVWTLIGGALAESCNVFVHAGGLIKSIPTPLVLHVYRMLARHMIILAHNLIIVVGAWLLFPWRLTVSALLALPGMIIVLVAVFGAMLVIAIACTRFRDLQQIVATVLQLAFLLTPIFWTPDTLRGKSAAILLDINPLYHLVEVVRGPLLGHPPALSTWLVASGIAVAAAAAGLAFYGRYKDRVVYWL